MAEAVVPALFFQQKSYLDKINKLQAKLTKLQRRNERAEVTALASKTWMKYALSLDMGRAFAIDTAVYYLFHSRKSTKTIFRVVETMRKRVARDDDIDLFEELEDAIARYEPD